VKFVKRFTKAHLSEPQGGVLVKRLGNYRPNYASKARMIVQMKDEAERAVYL
jgi:hypothetical protein